MHERSVTRAAEKLFLANGHHAALSRLRSLFAIHCVYRTGRKNGTVRARRGNLRPSLALPSIRSRPRSVVPPISDPATSTSVFRIGLSDDVEFALLPRLLKRFAPKHRASSSWCGGSLH